VLGSGIKWNFTKFLIDRKGRVAGRFAPTAEPKSLEGAIEVLL
jgi:glutathione peroxidase